MVDQTLQAHATFAPDMRAAAGNGGAFPFVRRPVGRFDAMLDHRAADLSLEVKGGEATFHMATQRLRHSASGLLTDLSGLSFYHRLFSWLIGEPIRIDGYGVYSEAQADRAMLERFFQQPIRFGEPDNHFIFPARYLDKPVVRIDLGAMTVSY